MSGASLVRRPQRVVLMFRWMRILRLLGFVSGVAVLASLLASSSAVAAQPPSGGGASAGEAGPYADTPAGAFYAEPVARLSERGVFAGTLCEAGFCPDEAVDRKTMAVWIVRLLDGADPAAVSVSSFSDVAADSFYAPFVERMAELGVTQGCGDGSRFCPDQHVTRAVMASFLARAYDLPAASAPTFSDVDADAWYASDVTKLAASGITTGCGDGSGFCPDDDTTRAQMAAFLWRTVNADGPTAPPVEVWAIGESVSVGAEHSCAVRADHTVTCWGSNDDNKTDAPSGKFLTVSAGEHQSCAVRIDRTLTCWGDSSVTLRFAGIEDAPPGFFVSVSAGNRLSCGLQVDQKITCWGPAGVSPTVDRFLSVSSGNQFACGVRVGQSAACWGLDPQNHFIAGPLHAPTGRFLSVSAGWDQACGVRADQSAVCWGKSGETRHAPTGRFLSVSAGDGAACGLRADRTIMCWTASGDSVDAPTGRFLSVSAGSGQACGLRADKAMECWALRGRDVPPTGKFLSLSTGGCGVRADQTLTCWSVDEYGRFHERSTPSGKFLSVSSQLSVSPQGSGKGDHCGVRADQTLSCWTWRGADVEEFGTLPPDKFVSVSRGPCALRADQTAACFRTGSAILRVLETPSGRFLSVSDFCGVRFDQTVTCWSNDRRDGGLLEAHAPSGRFLSVSDDCGIRVDETLACWNWNGQKEVPSGRFSSVSGFGSSTERCGVRADKTVTCWDYGAYPYKMMNDVRDEVVAGRFLSVQVIRGILGSRYKCGIRVDETLACWGFDADESPSGPYLSPTYRAGAPTLVWTGGSDDATAAATAKSETLSAGHWHSCGLRPDRTIQCWGSNFNWGSFPGYSGQADPVFGVFLAVSSGGGFSCGLRIDLSIACWGGKLTRFLAFPSVLDRVRDTYEQSGLFVSVSVGDGHGCGVRADQTAFCWGDDGHGEASAPAGRFSSVSAGGDHSCGVRVEGTISCWGDNGDGQVSAPVGRFLSVSAGGDHSCGVRVEGTISCWGDNGDGQVSAPVGRFLSVSAGGDHSCGVRVDQTITCWGSNQDRHGNHIGQAVAPSGRFLAVSAGHRHSCALGTDGAVTCWGDNSSGWPVDEAECSAWTGGHPNLCPGISDRDRPSGQSDPPAGRFLTPPPSSTTE